MLKKILISLAGLSIGGLIAGTQYFAHTARMTADIKHASVMTKADQRGIVVATGLDGRVAAGFRLMAEGHGERLLISGVGEGVRKADIRRIVQNSDGVTSGDWVGELDQLLECCVDLGFEARDTIGNAVEAKKWAETYQTKALVVVTSDFHMPRLMIAFENEFPEKNLIPHPVKTPWLQLNEDGVSGWWRSPDRIRLMMVEMVKYMARYLTS